MSVYDIYNLKIRETKKLTDNLNVELKKKKETVLSFEE